MNGDVGAPGLTGRHVLVVEDEYFIAYDLKQALENSGATVIGPVGTVGKALSLIKKTQALDGAVIDLNLRGESGLKVARALRERAIPFVFATGYDRRVVPEEFQGTAWFGKPFDTRDLVRALSR